MTDYAYESTDDEQAFECRWPPCPACGEREIAFIGTMNNTDWFTCRACGQGHQKPAKDDEE